MNEKYSKGNWTVSESGSVIMCGKDDIAHVYLSDKLFGKDQQLAAENQRANANIMAASPKMYHAMKKFMTDFVDFEMLFPETYKEFKDALAKADGKE